MGHIKSYQEFNEMNYSTYKSAADKLREKGHAKRADELDTHAENNKAKSQITDENGDIRVVLNIVKSKDTGDIQKYTVTCENRKHNFEIINELGETLFLVNINTSSDTKVFKLETRKDVNTLKKLCIQFGCGDAFKVESINNIYNG